MNRNVISPSYPDLKKADRRAALERMFPGMSCGNPSCENLCEGMLEIAECLSLSAKKLIASAIEQQLAPECGCIRQTGLPLSCHSPRCRFGFVRVLSDAGLPVPKRSSRKVIGKRYVADALASESGVCTECQQYDGRVFQWPEEAEQMPTLPCHPNCKCRYEDVYAEEEKESQEVASAGEQARL